MLAPLDGDDTPQRGGWSCCCTWDGYTRVRSYTIMNRYELVQPPPQSRGQLSESRICSGDVEMALTGHLYHNRTRPYCPPPWSGATCRLHLLPLIHLQSSYLP